MSFLDIDHVDELRVILHSLDCAGSLIGEHGRRCSDHVIEGAGVLFGVLHDRLKEITDLLEHVARLEGDPSIVRAVKDYCKSQGNAAESSLCTLIEKADAAGFTDWKRVSELIEHLMNPDIELNVLVKA